MHARQPHLQADVQDVFRFEQASGGIEAYRLLKNGLQVLLLPDDTVPVVTVMVTYRVGSRNESTGLTGATHFLEHLMFKGTERFQKEKGTSVFQVLQCVGAQVNATTWLDRTNYYELLPSEHLPLALEIEADRMRGALLREEEFERERTVILNELDRGENEPTRKLYQHVWSMAYLAHPYHHPTIGWRSDVESMRRDDLRHFYDTYYWPNNATLSIIGDFGRDEALSLVARHFGTIPPSPAPIPDIRTKEPEQRGERRLIIRQAGQLGAVMVAYKSPPGLHTDADALEVLSMVLASGKNSLLFRRLTDQGLTTHLFSGVTRLRDPGLFYLFAMLAPEKTHREVETAMGEVLKAVCEGGVSDDDVQRARRQLFAHEAFSRDGPFAMAAPLNEAIAVGDWQLYTTFIERINRVTREDLQRVARQYFLADTRTVGYYLPLTNGEAA